jgi:hypothetical protein
MYIALMQRSQRIVPFPVDRVGYDTSQIAQIAVYDPDKFGDWDVICIDWHDDYEVPVFQDINDQFFLLFGMANATYREVLAKFGYVDVTVNDGPVGGLDAQIKGSSPIQFSILLPPYQKNDEVTYLECPTVEVKSGPRGEIKVLNVGEIPAEYF